MRCRGTSLMNFTVTQSLVQSGRFGPSLSSIFTACAGATAALPLFLGRSPNWAGLPGDQAVQE